MKLRQRCARIDAQRRIQQLARRSEAIRRIDDFGNHRNARDAADRIGRTQYSFAEMKLAPGGTHGLGAQHQMRKVHVPGMRRHVGTLGHVAHVAQITVLDDFPVDRLVDAIELHRR